MLYAAIMTMIVSAMLSVLIQTLIYFRQDSKLFNLYLNHSSTVRRTR